MSNKLSSALGIQPLPKSDRANEMLENMLQHVPQQEIMSPESGVDCQFREDFQKSRKDLDDVIKTGMESLSDLAGLAGASDDHKAYVALSGLIRALVEANQKRVELYALKQSPEPSKSTTTNNLFVGTTADLLKVIRNRE